MSEQLLAGGDVDTVVRVGDTVRRPDDEASGETMLTGGAWLEEKREELQRWL